MYKNTSDMSVYRSTLIRTLLIVCEGLTEEHFLRYLQKLYYIKGGGNVLKYFNRLPLLKSSGHCQYLIFMDTDNHFPSKKDVQLKGQIHAIGTTPCLEGLFLKILQKQVVNDSYACKMEWASHIKIDIKDIPKLTQQDYEEHLPKTILDRARDVIPELQELLGLFEGNWPNKIIYLNGSLLKLE